MTQEPAEILIVEDEAGMRKTLSGILEDAGHSVTDSETGSEALKRIRENPYDIVITDIRLPDVSGLEILEVAREVNPEAAVIMITGYASLETAVDAINEGAYAYFVKPVNIDEVKTTINNALKQQRLLLENRRLVEDLQLSNRRLAEANEELMKLSQLKSEFLANMSHELRTPLNAILGFSELLLDRVPGEINEQQEQCLRDILVSGHHLLQLINDVLDLSKIEAGKIEFRPEHFDLREVIATVERTTATLLAEKGHELKMGVDEALPSIYADGGKIRQVILNLLSNAIRFTPSGGKIAVQAVKEGDACKVSVSDNGIGIREEDIVRIFDEFVQADRSGVGGEGGTGLGLTIAKRFVQMHGGHIWAESEYGKGSTFAFSLPKSV